MTGTSDLVFRIAVRAIGPEQVDSALAALIESSAGAPDTERERVQLAVLKLYEEDSGRDLAKWARAAKADYRDVLYWAESPGEAQAGAHSRISPERLKALRIADHEQLAAWLNRVA